MPTTYAHYTFGQEVLKLLNDDIKKIINENIDLFNIGLHGPDILFYYKALKSNPISKIGHNLHKLRADKFFENARNVIRNCEDQEAACSYILGFICHFMLDSECHPYIRKKESIKLTHSAIETEFDRMFMVKNNLNPVSFKPTSHIVPKDYNALVISWFFEEVSKDEILNSLKSMKFYLNFLVAPNPLKRYLIILGLKLSGNYENMIGLLMNYKQEKKCIEINEKLYELYENAIKPTADIIREFNINISSNENLNVRFNKNFE